MAEHDTQTKRELTPEEREQKRRMRALGRALWRMEQSDKPKLPVEEARRSWTEGRRRYMAEAKKLARALGREGVTFSVAAKAESGEEPA